MVYLHLSSCWTGTPEASHLTPDQELQLSGQAGHAGTHLAAAPLPPQLRTTLGHGERLNSETWGHAHAGALGTGTRLALGMAPTGHGAHSSDSSPASELPESPYQGGLTGAAAGSRCRQGSGCVFLSAWQGCGQLSFLPIPILIPGLPIRPSPQNEFSGEQKDTVSVLRLGFIWQL